MGDFRNLIVEGLPALEHQIVAGKLAEVAFKRDDTIFAANAAMSFVVFPATCVVSLSIELPEGREVECAAIGYEGGGWIRRIASVRGFAFASESTGCRTGVQDGRRRPTDLLR